MLNTIELRRGNLVIFSGTPNLQSAPKGAIKVEDVLQNGVNLSEDGMVIYQDAFLFAIPISEYIIERCGFSKSTSNDENENTLWSIQVANNTSLYYEPSGNPQWYLSYEWNNNHFKNEFWGSPECLHELQNLFYCLSGDELQVENILNG